MKRDSWSGTVLIIGSIGFLVTMAFHPSAHGLEALARQAGTARWTHSLALASVPVTFLGFLGLWHRLRAATVLAPVALTVFGFGSVAVTSGAVLNGFGAAGLAVHFADDPAAQQAVEAGPPPRPSGPVPS